MLGGSCWTELPRDGMPNGSMHMNQYGLQDSLKEVGQRDGQWGGSLTPCQEALCNGHVFTRDPSGCDTRSSIAGC